MKLTERLHALICRFFSHAQNLVAVGPFYDLPHVQFGPTFVFCFLGCGGGKRFPQASAHSGATGGDAILGFAVCFFVAIVDGCPAD